MTRTTNFISTTNSSPPPAEPPSASVAESDFAFTLASFIFMVITSVALISAARCAWLRRRGWAIDFDGASPASRGLKNKVIRSLPKFTYDSSSGRVSDDCAICLAEYADGDEVRMLPPCGHCFHVFCVDTWLVSHSSCPSCRRILVASRGRKCAGSEVKNSGDSAIANSSV